MKIETLQHVSKGRRRTTVLLRALACCAFLCTSCAMEEELADSVMGGSTTMKINVDAHAGDDGEETVRTVRILTVDARDREVVANQLFQGPGASGEYTVKAFTGKNNFYVICNETPGMTRQLESVRQADDIEPVTLETSDIGLPLTMYARMKNVEIEGGNQGYATKVTTEDGVVSDRLQVQAKRMMAKLNFTVIKNVVSGDDFTVSDLKVRIVRRPASSFVGEHRPYPTDAPRENDLTVEGGSGQVLNAGNNGNYNADHSIPAGTDKIELSPVYLPEYIQGRTELSDCVYLIITARCTFPTDGWRMPTIA